ncbi:hypothetical protein MUK42_06244 [Musa troglodytarum]|uniref:Uncharacterized protein n=1 Tax=Musa troglodytarum TaxID=320322 RepID=A0A9E7KF18_9LILI|nr:hypothetical protein MUK42_06244 [Musa troglodytarum]
MLLLFTDSSRINMPGVHQTCSFTSCTETSVAFRDNKFESKHSEHEACRCECPSQQEMEKSAMSSSLPPKGNAHVLLFIEDLGCSSKGIWSPETFICKTTLFKVQPHEELVKPYDGEMD